MRKALLIILAILILCPLMASVNPSSSNAYKHLLDPVSVTSVRMKGMGGAGIALTEGADSLFINPAGLASKSYDLSVPYVVITVYNPGEIHDTRLVSSWLKGDDLDYGNIALDYLDSLGIYNKVARLDAGFALTLKGFGFGLSVQDTLHTYSSGGRSVSTSLINQLNIMATFGYGRRFPLPCGLSIDAGLSLSLNYLAYNEAVGASGVIDAIDMDDFSEYINSNVPFLAGYAVPLTAGVTFNTPIGISVTTLFSNINGNYYMHSYDNLKSLKHHPFKAFSSKDFDFFTDPCLSTGMAWTADWIPHFKPTVALDFVDIIGFFEDDVSFREFFGHTRLGVELRLFTHVNLRCGISEGYFSFGAGFDFYAVEIDFAYFCEEYGSEYGSKSVDGLSFRLKIGW